MDQRTSAGDTPLRRIREDRELSQAQLAEAAQTSQAQIDRLEKSKRTMTVAWAKRLARVLECHWLDLLDEPHADNSPAEQSHLDRVRQLSESDQATVFRVAEALASERRKTR